MLACAVGAAELARAFGPVYKGGHTRNLELRVPKVLLVEEDLSTPGVITSRPGRCPATEREMVASELIPCYEMCPARYTVPMVPAVSLGFHHGAGEHLPAGKASCGVGSAA